MELRGQNPSLSVAKLDAVARRAAFVQRRLRIDRLVHRCAARSINRSQERPPRLKSGGNPSAAHAARRRRGPRAHRNLRARQSPVRLKSCTATVHETATLTRRRGDALSRNAQDAQGPEQKATKARPAPSASPTRSRLRRRAGGRLCAPGPEHEDHVAADDGRSNRCW